MKKLLLIIGFLLFTVNCYGALVEGTNAGFVLTAPTVDPAGPGTVGIDSRAVAFKDTSPSNATLVTEIGWWCNEATEAANYEVAIYTHDAVNDRPDSLIAGYSQTNAKGTIAGWKAKTGLNISISPSTIYWIVVQLDDTATTTNFDGTTDVSYRYDYKSTQTTLPDPWGVSSFTGTRIIAFYAVYTTTVATTAEQVIMVEE